MRCERKILNMPRYNVKYKEKWACFSSISEGFVTEFMDTDSYEEWRKAEYGLIDYKPLEERNAMDMQDAVCSIKLNRNRDDAIKCLLETGLPETECKQLMYDMETKYYVPNLQENGTYQCPNCSSVVEKGQERCSNEFCENELIWRD